MLLLSDRVWGPAYTSFVPAQLSWLSCVSPGTLLHHLNLPYSAAQIWFELKCIKIRVSRWLIEFLPRTAAPGFAVGNIVLQHVECTESGSAWIPRALTKNSSVVYVLCFCEEFPHRDQSSSYDCGEGFLQGSVKRTCCCVACTLS